MSALIFLFQVIQLKLEIQSTIKFVSYNVHIYIFIQIHMYNSMFIVAINKKKLHENHIKTIVMHKRSTAVWNVL